MPGRSDTAQGMEPTLSSTGMASLLAHLAANRYQGVRSTPCGGICGVQRFLYTGGLVVGLDFDSYRGRYCYETVEQALQALAAWDGAGDPPGKWIKYKAADQERLGPGAVCP